MRIDLNHRYNESDIIRHAVKGNIGYLLTSIGTELKQIASDNRDWKQSAPGASKYQTVCYRINTNVQTIYIYQDFNDEIGSYFNCRITNKDYSNEIKPYKVSNSNWLSRTLLPLTSFLPNILPSNSYFLKKKFDEYNINEKYDLSYIMDGKKYLFTAGMGSWDNSGSFYKKCINTETNETVFLYAEIGRNFDTPCPIWETKEEEHLDKL